MSLNNKRLVGGINTSFINILANKTNYTTIGVDNNGLSIKNTNNNVQSGTIELDPPQSNSDNISLTQPNDVLKQANINMDINIASENASELLLGKKINGVNVIRNSGILYNLSTSNNNLPTNVGDKKVLVVQKNTNSLSLETIDSNLLGGGTDDDSNKANLSLIDNVYLNNNTFNYTNNNRISISGIYNQATSGNIIVLDGSNKVIPSNLTLNNLALLNTTSLTNYSTTTVNNSLYASLTNTNIFSGVNTFNSVLLSGNGVGKVTLAIPSLTSNYTLTLPLNSNLTNNSTWILGTNSTSSPYNLSWIDLGNLYLTQTTAASTYLTQSDATSTYLTQASAVSTYLTQISASNTYLNVAIANSDYLKKTDASSTYLTQSNAASNYLTQSNATLTFLSKTVADSDFLNKTDAISTYLSQTNAASTYLSQASAASTYLSQANASSTYLTQTSASSTYLTSATAASTYGGLLSANTWSGVNKFNLGKLLLVGNGGDLTINASQSASSSAYTLEYPTAAPSGTMNVLTTSGLSPYSKYTWTDLSTYLTQANAASTYLTQANAVSTYDTISTAKTITATKTFDYTAGGIILSNTVDDTTTSNKILVMNASGKVIPCDKTYSLLNSTLASGALTNVANTFTAAQTFTYGNLKIEGAATKTITLNAPSMLSSSYTLNLPLTNPTSGTTNVLRSTSTSSPYDLSWVDLNTIFLTTSNAASTYLTISNAASTYLTSATAASTYLTSATAASTYLTSATAASTYMKLTGTNANSGINTWTGVNTFNTSNPIVITNPNSNLTTASSGEKLLAIDTSTGTLKLTNIAQNSINGGITTTVSSLFDEEFSFESGVLATASIGVNQKFNANMTVVNSGGSILTDNKLSYFSTGTLSTHFAINNPSNYYPYGGGTVITLSTWIKWNNSGTSSGETDGIGLFTGSDFSLFTMKMNSGNLSFTYFAQDGNRPEVVLTSFTSSNPVFRISNNLGKWVFLSVTLNSANNSISVYIRSLDSTLYSGSIALSTPVNTTSGTETIGRFKFISTNNNGVNIANFFITKSALTNAQIDMLANLNMGNIISTSSLAKADAAALYTGLSGMNSNSATNTWSGVNKFNSGKFTLAGNGGDLVLNASQSASSSGYTLEYPTAAPTGIMNVLTTSGLSPYSKYTWTDLSSYLTSANAASTYLSQANASSTYLTQANAASTYLTQANASSTYLTQANAASTYLTAVPSTISTNVTISGNLTAVNLFNYGYNAQSSITGGGNVTWTKAMQLYWDSRIFIGPLNAAYGSNGNIYINCPTSGTIAYYNGLNNLTTVSCDANGIQFDNTSTSWNALYYVITPGQVNTSDSSKLVLVNFQNTTWKPSSNWILIACLNNDISSLKWMPGNINIPIGSTYYSSLSTIQYSLRYEQTFQSGNSGLNITSSLSVIPNGIYEYICTGTDIYNNVISIVNGYFVKSILGTTYYGISNIVSYQKVSGQFIYLTAGSDSLINGTATDIYVYNKSANKGVCYIKMNCIDTNPPPDLLPMPPSVSPYAQFKFETFDGSDNPINSKGTFEVIRQGPMTKVTTGKFGAAIRQLSSSSNCLYFKTFTLPAMAQGCTFMAWYKEGDGTNTYLMKFQTNFYKTGAMFNIQNNGNINLLINATTFTWTRPAGIDYVNTIVHYALVVDLSQQKFIVYVNGNLLEAKSYSSYSTLVTKLDGLAFTPTQGGNDMIIDGQSNGGSTSFIDDYRMYTTPVSGDDILRIYTATSDST